MQKAEPVHTPTWHPPDLGHEAEEITRTAADHSLDPAALHHSASKGKLVPLDDHTWSHMENTDSWGTTKPGQAEGFAKEYGRDLGRVQQGIKSGAHIPAPIVMHRPGAAPYLVGGNTRLMAARSMGHRPMVWAFNHGEAQKTEDEYGGSPATPKGELDKAGGMIAGQPAHVKLNLPVGSQVNDRIKVKHGDGTESNVKAASGMIQALDADAPLFGAQSHPVPSRQPGGR